MSPPSTASGTRRSERGASAVEFALVLPGLLLLVGGIIDFGFIFSQQINFNTAVRDAARSAVVEDYSGGKKSCQQVADAARTSIGAGAIGADRSKVTVTVTGPGGGCTMAGGSNAVSANGTIKPCTNASGTNQNVDVTVSYPSKPPVPIPLASTITLTATGNFQCEYA